VNQTLYFQAYYPNTAIDAVLTDTVDLREYVPDGCRDLLDMEANDLRSEIPAISRWSNNLDSQYWDSFSVGIDVSGVETLVTIWIQTKPGLIYSRILKR
jgi:hypothetical protein